MTGNQKENSFIGWLRKVSVRNKFSIIIGLIIFILVFEFVNFWLSIKVASGLRAYVGGEGLWSKAEKAADNSIIKYSTSYDENDYLNFSNDLIIPNGDKQARLELEKPNPNLKIVDEGFLNGGNNPGDISDMRFLFQKFRHVSYMEKAISIWSQGDMLISELSDVGRQIHYAVIIFTATHDPEVLKVQTARLAMLTKQADILDQQLTILENNFSSTLGEGSRNIRDLLIWLTFGLTAILGIIVIFISYLIRKVIVQVDIAKSEFVSLASHQLRTPLTVIKWQASRVLVELEHNQKNPDTQAIKTYNNSIYSTSQQMIELVNAILNVSKIDLGKLTIQPVTISVTSIIDKLLEELEPEINMKSLKIYSNYQAKLPQINFDPQLLRIVILNILTNSLKYTNNNGSISISAKKNISGILIEIADTGCGIAYKDQAKIFDKFFRTEAAKTIDPNGNGLGMYIVYAIMQQTNSQIWFESKPNQGTTFYLQLPINGSKNTPGTTKLKE